MPTNEWFEKIAKHVDFKGKSVIDYGCAEGIMCKHAKQAGATYVLGIDNQQHFQPHEGVVFANEEIGVKQAADIKMFSMIIHWIGKDEFIKHADSSEVVVIFREPNPGYQIPINGKWFPTLQELSVALNGYSLIHNELLLEQDNNKRVTLAIYDRKKG